MPNDDGWWARKLGNPQPQQQYPPTQYQPQPAPQYQQAPQYPQQQQQQQQQPRVTAENLYQAALTWQGGEAHRTEVYNCPKCGGGHYFSRSAGVSRGPAPAPMCYDCGYNGMFTQGDPATYAG